MERLNFAVLVFALLFLQFLTFAQQWETNGTSDIFYNYGNVGIGTSSPSAKLNLLDGIFRLSYSNGGVNIKNWDMNYDNSGYFYIDEFGVNRHFAIKDGGNVGIGTTNPLYKLDVAGDFKVSSVGKILGTLSIGEENIPTNIQLNIKTDYSYPISMENGNHSYNRLLFTDVSGGINLQEIKSGTDGYYDFRGNSVTATLMRIHNNGNVGIGTDNPVYKLDVAGNLKVSSTLTIGDGSASNVQLYLKTNYDYPIRIDNGSNSYNRLLFNDVSGGMNLQEIKSGADGYYDFRGNSVTATLMRINNNGNVGIGTTNPLLPLHISTGLQIGTSSTANQNFHLVPHDWDNVWGLRLYSGNNGSGSLVATFTNNGELCIGTHKPYVNNSQNSKLSVNGTITSKEIYVKANGWPDYVFNKDYNLMPLSELESFINANSHLPEIPNAEEIDKNGVELGNMSSKLLQKIEELTLYIIQLQKEIDDLKKATHN